VERSEIAPSVTMPLHLGSWLSVTPTFTLRSTYYGGQIQNGSFVNQGFFRNTEELSVDIRPPTLDRVWGSSDSGTKWKHVIEPEIVYSYVNGVTDFSRFVRFDEDETLSNTNEVRIRGYAAPLPPQKRWHRRGNHQLEAGAKIFLRSHFWRRAGYRAAQRVPNHRCAYAFCLCSSPTSFSPIVSDLRFEPGNTSTRSFIVISILATGN